MKIIFPSLRGLLVAAATLGILVSQGPPAANAQAPGLPSSPSTAGSGPIGRPPQAGYPAAGQNGTGGNRPRPEPLGAHKAPRAPATGGSAPAGRGPGPTAQQQMANQPPGSAMPPEVALQRALTLIDSQPSISARIRQQIQLLGHQLVGSGSYHQIGRAEQRRFRLELKVPVGDGMSSFERIQTGEYLWVCEELGDKTTLSQIDVVQVRQALARRRPTGQRVGAAPALGMPLEGLPKLVANLNEAFQFTSIRAGSLDQLAVWQLEGAWKPAALAEWSGNQKSKILAGEAVDWTGMPLQLPDRVVLTLGRDDYFPYRIEFFRRPPPSKIPTAVAASDTLATLEFFEVRFGGDIAPERFVFQPGNRAFVKATEAYLKQLGITDLPPPRGEQTKLPVALPPQR
jgi:hypothetical protein